MADSKKKSVKLEVKAYSNDKEVKEAFKAYTSNTKERRSIMKRFLKTKKEVLAKVFIIVPCNWYEAISGDSKRIIERNKGHKKATKFSLVAK
jgi:hypothetical protein